MEPIVSLHKAGMTRRNFLSQTGTLALAGLTGSTLADSVNSTLGLAQETPTTAAGRRPQRVAVVGIDHYHAISPPNYLQILKNEKIDIVGIHAPDIALATKYASMYNSAPYSDYREMVEKTKPEFVIALGHHSAMPTEFRYLVSTGIPFMMEKPWGTDERTVNELANLAEAKKAWVALPTPFRFSWFGQRAVEMRKASQLGDISHIVIRFNNNGIQRYIDLNNEWMLSKKEAGGGALVNLGIHGFDLCRYITGEEPKVISAVTSHAMFRQEIEDYALVVMRTPSGIVCINEASYTGTGTEHSLSSQKFNLSATTMGGEGVQISVPGKPGNVEHAPEGYLAGWPGCVRDCLDRIGRGEPPPANARDGARASSLAFEAYRMADEKGLNRA